MKIRNKQSKEEKQAYQKKWRDTHVNEIKVKRELNKEKESIKKKIKRDFDNINNPEKRIANLAYKKAWRDANPERVKFTSKIYAQTNPGMRNALTAKYYTSKLNATPKWLTPLQLKQIESIYKLSSTIQKLTGIKHHVDHIIPLQGKTVSGLHVPWNLRVMQAYGPNGNISKSNKLI